MKIKAGTSFEETIFFLSRKSCCCLPVSVAVVVLVIQFNSTSPRLLGVDSELPLRRRINEPFFKIG